MTDQQFVLAVVGPTASGKTALGIALALHVGGEVVSADSMQIYTGMEIATAKPTPEERSLVPHHLVDFVSPTQKYSVAEYVAAADAVMAQLKQRGKTPVLVGGTGLYVDSLLQHVQFLPEQGDAALRAALEDQYRQQGGQACLDALAQQDPEAAAKLHPNDMRRVVRAMEVLALSGVSKTQQEQRSRAGGTPYRPLYIGLQYADRQLLYDRIGLRVDQMLEAGLLEEAEASYRMGLGATAVQAIGHKELYPYFAGECTLEEAVESLKRETRRYAKRQLTWFRRNPAIHWITCDGKTKAETVREAIEIYELHLQKEEAQ